jgi:hypothetical protein
MRKAPARNRDLASRGLAATGDQGLAAGCDGRLRSRTAEDRLVSLWELIRTDIAEAELIELTIG